MYFDMRELMQELMDEQRQEYCPIGHKVCSGRFHEQSEKCNACAIVLPKLKGES